MISDIADLEGLFRGGDGSKILSQKVQRLTAPGDHYGSLMLKLDIRLKSLRGVEELQTVAKTFLIDPKVEKIWSKEKAFQGEHAVYSHIHPLLCSFQRHHGVKILEFFPKCYGSRLNLTGGDEVTTDAVIVLENLSALGYGTVDRTIGFGLDSTKTVLGAMAQFHAITLAFRLQEPEEFQAKIVPHLLPWNMHVGFHNQTKEKLQKIIERTPVLLSLKTRILEGFDKKLRPPQHRQPFTTVIHNDLWVGNIMVKPDSVKILDFQLIALGSLSKDLIFFLFLSVENEVLEGHYDELVRLYFDSFRLVLRQLNCDPKCEFEELEKETEIEAQHSQFGHLLFMLNVIFGPRNVDDSRSMNDIFEDEPTDLYVEKLVFIVQQFAKRNWI